MLNCSLASVPEQVPDDVAFSHKRLKTYRAPEWSVTCVRADAFPTWTFERSSGNTGGICVVARHCGCTGGLSNGVYVKSCKGRGGTYVASRLCGDAGDVAMWI